MKAIDILTLGVSARIRNNKETAEVHRSSRKVCKDILALLKARRAKMETK